MKFLSTGLPTYAKKLALDIGLHGHNEYIRFIILGRSRVGSNLLRGLLNSHPHIVTYGEVFKDCSSLDWDHLGYFQSRGLTEKIRRDPVDFLDNKPSIVAVVGFL